MRTAVFWMTTKLTDETVTSDTSILIVFEGRTTHVWDDSDPTWVFLVGFEACFVVSATNSNYPCRGLLGFFVSVVL